MDMVDTSSGSLLTAEERVKVGGEDDVAAQSKKKLMSSRDGDDVHNNHSATQDEMDVVTSTSESNSCSTSSNNLHYYDPQVISRYIQFYKNNGESSPKQQTNHNTPSSSTEGGDTALLPPKKKKPKRKSKKHIDPAVLTIRREIQFCCKENNLIRALQIFRMALCGQRRNCGDNDNVDDNKLLSSSSLVKLEPQTFYNLLNLCDGSFGNTDGSSGGGRIHVGTPKVTKDSSSPSLQQQQQKQQQQQQQQQRNDSTRKESEQTITLQQRLIHAKQIHTLLTQLNIPCIEPAFTALIRLAVRVGDYDLAEQYLVEAERTQQCKVKLRMYSSLLRGYCGDCLNTEEDDGVGVGGDKSSDGSSRVVKATQEGLIKALKVWKRMYDKSGGMSTGHPRYHETATVQQEVDSSSTTTNTATKVPLFGEGISPKISLSEYEYSSLLKCATALWDTKVAERVLSDLAESVSVPGLSTVEVMLRWFRSDRGATTKIFSSDTNVDEEVISSALDNVTLPPREGEGLSVGPVTNDTGKGWNIYRNCTIDSSTGILYLGNPETKGSTDKEHHQRIQYRLKPVELTQKAWKAMREMNSSIVLEGTVEGNISPFQGGGKGKKRPRGSDVVSKLHNDQIINNNSDKKKDPNWRINHWKEFETFIEDHPPFNIVIDGANVGYYNQAFRLGSSAPKHVDYRQIDGLVRHLLENSCSIEQHHIILFLHERHFSPKLLPQWAHPLIKMWDGDEAPYDRLTVYRTPQGLNDDWYWMHAALINGGRDDKPSVLAITNDEMRDHHFQMTAQGYFLRWKERHQVHFDFGDWDRDLKRNKVLLEYPSIYSRRIQRVVGESSCDADVVTSGADAIVIPLPKKGDENRFVDGVHVADDGIPEDETYVVIEKVIS